MVNTARTRGQRGFQQIDPIGGENEQDVSVFRETVHLIQQMKKQGDVAVEWCSAATVAFILDSGADLNRRDDDGEISSLSGHQE